MQELKKTQIDVFIIIVILLLLLTNIILDKTGISQKYFSSSGAFIYIIFCGLWIICSLLISYDIFLENFAGDFWYFTFWPSWLLILIIGPIILLFVQLIYSYLIKRLIIKS